MPNSRSWRERTVTPRKGGRRGQVGYRLTRPLTSFTVTALPDGSLAETLDPIVVGNVWHRLPGRRGFDWLRQTLSPLTVHLPARSSPRRLRPDQAPPGCSQILRDRPSGSTISTVLPKAASTLAGAVGAAWASGAATKAANSRAMNLVMAR